MKRGKTIAKEKSARATSARKSTRAAVPELRRSTAASLLKHAKGWTGDDLDNIIRIVTESRSKTRF